MCVYVIQQDYWMTFWIKLINDNKLIGTHKRVECVYTERAYFIIW